MPNLPVLQGHWRLLETDEVTEAGDQIWFVDNWIAIDEGGVGWLQKVFDNPIRRRVAPTPKCETCLNWAHTLTSSGPCSGMYCKQGLGKGVTSLPQDGSGWCCLHPQAQEVTR